MTDVQFPPMSRDDPEATGVLATWYVADGDRVADGQLLADVQMDKVDAEVASPAAGIIHLVVAEESEVVQGSVIATID